jgi:dipeptidyl aminopeptidase/acylaminoacyl peptidase
VYDKGTVSVPVTWKQDGRELLFWSSERALLAADVSSGNTLTLGEPRPLFRLSAGVAFNAALGRPGVDGERFVIAKAPKPVVQQITVFDRQGKIMRTVGEPGRYVQPALSPDGTKVAVMKTDMREGDVDIWTYDVDSGKGAAVTVDTWPENAPIWAPDSRTVAYASTRGTFSSIFRRAWDGSGNEEQLFQHSPGAGIVLSDWSRDGKYLTFHDGVLHLVPIQDGAKALERKSIAWLQDEFNVSQARFSPDMRFIAYISDEHKTREETNWGIADVYVRPFDPSVTDATKGPPPVRVSSTGARGMIMWRQDGRELYYITPEWEVMVVDVMTTPAFKAATPRLLFKLPAPVIGNPQQWRNVSADGQRFVFTVNVPEPTSPR